MQSALLLSPPPKKKPLKVLFSEMIKKVHLGLFVHPTHISYTPVMCEALCPELEGLKLPKEHGPTREEPLGQWRWTRAVVITAQCRSVLCPGEGSTSQGGRD